MEKINTYYKRRKKLGCAKRDVAPSSNKERLCCLPFINAASFLSDLVRRVVIFIVQAFSKLHHLIDLVIIGVHALLEFFMLLNQFLHGFHSRLLRKSTEHKFTTRFTDTLTTECVSGAYSDRQKSLGKVCAFGAFSHTPNKQSQANSASLANPPAPHSIVWVGEGKRDMQRRIFERRAVPFQATVALQLIRCTTASQRRFFTVVANMPSRAVSLVYYEYTQYLVVLTPLSSFDRNNSCWPRMASHCFESRMNN